MVDGVGVPIYLCDFTTKVVDDNLDLWDGDVDNVISKDQFGNPSAGHLWAFTGTYKDGTKHSYGLYANAGGPLGNPGEVSQGNGGVTTDWVWRQWTSDPGATLLPLYGLSEIIPEPASMCLLGLGGLLLRRKR